MADYGDCEVVRILHVSDCFLPRLGGIEVQVDELSRAQQNAGHTVTVATATPPTLAPESLNEPLDRKVHRVVLPLPWELPVGGSVQPVYDRIRPDVVHVHAGVVSPFAWRALRRARLARIPAVLTIHSIWGPVSSTTYRALFARWHARWDGGLVVTTVSQAAAAPVRAVVGDRVPVRVVSNGIDAAAWRETWPWLPTGRILVVAVGRLAPRKEPMTLLRLLKTVRRQTPITAMVVGDGPAQAAMERYIHRNEMTGWVRLTGRLDRAEIREILGAADIFLAPAARESFGLAALEARLAGVPVVAQAGSGVADFVTSGREGLLGRDFTELSGALLRLAADHELRDKIAAYNRATEPAGCSWPAVLDSFDRCYEQASARVRTPTAGARPYWPS